MSDDDGTRLRNVSTHGDLDVPDLGRIIEHLHEVVVADIDIARRLIETGHFIEVAKPGPKPTEPTEPVPAVDTAGQTPTTPAV